jgi:hypothetical protein
MDGLIRQKYPNYRRGVLRILSTIGGLVMLYLHLSPITRGFWSSMAEIGLLACFLLWIVSQYNAWGRVHIAYVTSPDDLEEFSFSSKYKKMLTSDGSLEIIIADKSPKFQDWEEPSKNVNYCPNMEGRMN